ncbi:hypothetical protein [Acerihabitans sp.]|uniref:hypothetical protein n=1 Tax=Acerihabitans sp. TaxID=2811394 RepID=UPI002ED77CA6
MTLLNKKHTRSKCCTAWFLSKKRQGLIYATENKSLNFRAAGKRRKKIFIAISPAIFSPVVYAGAAA